MFRSVVYPRGPKGSVSFNMTPLVDVAFQLILFFILASEMASKSLPDLQIPQPHRSQAVAASPESARVIVNVVAADLAGQGPGGGPLAGAASHYEIDGGRIELGDLQRLRDVLGQRRRRAPTGSLIVEVRADRRVRYGDVFPVMAAATAAGIPRMNVTAMMEAGS